MVRVLSLVWTLLLSLSITSVSFFYVREDFKHGFPFSFAKDQFASDGTTTYSLNYFSVAFDILVWWLLFSLLWIIIKNYVLELD